MPTTLSWFIFRNNITTIMHVQVV